VKPPSDVEALDAVAADEITALAELARTGLRLLHALSRFGGFSAVSASYPRDQLAPALSLLVRFALKLKLGSIIVVRLDEQLGIAAVTVDGQAISPEQWLALEKAGLPMLALRADETP